MNLRQQFFWKVLLFLSIIAILYSSWNTWNKFTTARDKISDYENEMEVKDNEDITNKTDFILRNQKIRKEFNPNSVLINEKAVMNHIRAGIKIDSGGDWASKDPVYTTFFKSNKSSDGNICVVEYRDEPKTEYMVGDKIDGTNMLIQSCNKDSIVVHIDSNKGTQMRVFYISKTKKE